MGGPSSEGISQRLLAPATRHLGEKPLNMPEAVGEGAPREQPEGIACVPAQITGASQANHWQKKEGQQRLATGGGPGVGQSMRNWLACWQCCLQGGEKTSLPCRRKQKQAAYTFLPGWLRGIAGVIFSPCRGPVGSVPNLHELGSDGRYSPTRRIVQRVQLGPCDWYTQE